MKAISRLLAVFAIGAIAGCHGSESPPSSPPPPTTAPTAAVPTSINAGAPAAPVVIKSAALPDKDMTHSLSADSPYFATKPKKDEAPTGTLKAGTKVLVLIPGDPYSKVTAQDGTTAYTMTDNLQPLGK